MISLLFKVPITSPHEQDLRKACRGTLLLTLVTSVHAACDATRGPESLQALLGCFWPFIAAALLYHVLGRMLYRAHLDAWTTLTAESYMKCPKCGLSLIHAASGGTCTECTHRYQIEELRIAWHDIYRQHLSSMRPGIEPLPGEFRAQVAAAA